MCLDLQKNIQIHLECAVFRKPHGTYTGIGNKLINTCITLLKVTLAHHFQIYATFKGTVFQQCGLFLIKTINKGLTIVSMVVSH